MSAAALIETPRLRLRRLAPGDAPFILELLNDPAFLQYIGDKGVRTEEDARGYIRNGPMASYERFGFGLFLVSLTTGEPIGMCGLLKRDSLDDADLGFAFLPGFRADGYGFEAAVAVLAHARAAWGLTRVLAITSPDNVASIGLLEKLGFVFARMAQLKEAEPSVKVFARGERSG
jgi:RimJ/RimL family protein N-acetyltransferase